MDKEIPKDSVNFEISSESPNGSKVVFPLSKKRSFVGRGLACDVVIPFGDVSTIHAVVEITKKNKIKIYDLNSKNGTKVNGERIVVAEVDVDSPFYLGDNKVSVSEFKTADMAPPPLDMISSLPPAFEQKRDSVERKDLPKAPPPSVIPDSDDVVPRINILWQKIHVPNLVNISLKMLMNFIQFLNMKLMIMPLKLLLFLMIEFKV